MIFRTVHKFPPHMCTYTHIALDLFNPYVRNQTEYRSSGFVFISTPTSVQGPLGIPKMKWIERKKAQKDDEERTRGLFSYLSLRSSWAFAVIIDKGGWFFFLTAKRKNAKASRSKLTAFVCFSFSVYIAFPNAFRWNSLKKIEKTWWLQLWVKAWMVKSCFLHV